MSVLLSSLNLSPDYISDFARNSDESAFPELWDGLVGAWSPSLGPTDLDLFDHAPGKLNNGTLANMDASTAWLVTERGYVLDYAGDDDYIVIPDSPSISPTSAIAISAWIKGGTQVQRIASHYDGPPVQRGWLLLGATSNFRIIISRNGQYNGSDAKDYTSSIAVFDNTWHYIAITFDGSSLTLYIDGIEDTTPTKTQDGAITSIHDSTADMLIGAESDSGGVKEFFTGQIGDVFIYNRALVQSEIRLIFEGAHPLISKKSILLSVSGLNIQYFLSLMQGDHL